MITGCGSSTTVSPPLLIDECKVVPKDLPAGPDDRDMSPLSTPVRYTPDQIKSGVNRQEEAANRVQNNNLWEEDRTKAASLQKYILTLQDKGIIAK